MSNTKIVNGALVTEIPVDTSVTNDQLERQSFKYEVARIKTFRGMDGQGLNAVLIRDHKAIAELLDEGCGGEMHFDWLDQKHGESAEEAMFKAFIEEEKLKIPADKKDPDTGMLERSYFSGESWVNAEVDRIMNERRFRKTCKTKTMFQVGDKIGGDEFLVIKGVDDKTRQYILKKYAGQKVRILNDEYK